MTASVLFESIRNKLCHFLNITVRNGLMYPYKESMLRHFMCIGEYSPVKHRKGFLFICYAAHKCSYFHT